MQNEIKTTAQNSFFYKDAADKLDKRVIRVVELLSLSNKSIATAESCTGGLLSEMITSVPGASKVFECGVCSYSNRIKHSILGVDQNILDKYTEVSEQTAAAMAEGMKKLSGADIAVSVTGIAGPGGGTPEKPVGIVYAGFAVNGKSFAKLLDFSGKGYDRETIRKCTALSVFETVEKLLEGEKDYE